MPLWALFTLTFLAFAAAILGALYFYTTTVLAVLATGSTYVIASERALFLVFLVLLVLAVLLILLARSISKPLDRVTTAVDIFAKTAQRTPIEVGKGAPKEVRSLVESFARMSANVEESHKRDQEVARVKSDFISTAAHQLRTPLTGIRWALEALSSSNPTEDQKALIGSAVEKSRELVAIVGTLLDISSIESGKYKYQFTAVDITSVLREVMNDFDKAAKEKQLSFELVPSGAPAPAVRADRERIKWVITNLVENAIRYTPPGGSVTLATSTGANRLFIHVRDTGIGILPQDRTNIFERFFRGANAVSAQNEGNGLGLYIARTIATDHGGDLTFAPNDNGQGTTFTLGLPV